jgi:hypothetical protein
MSSSGIVPLMLVLCMLTTGLEPVAGEHACSCTNCTKRQPTRQVHVASSKNCIDRTTAKFMHHPGITCKADVP